MAKGKSSSGSINRMVTIIEQFIAGWAGTRTGRYPISKTGEWPAIYKIAILRGEAIARLRFFDHFIPNLNISLTEQQKINAWDSLATQSTILEDFINRVGIAHALKREAAIPEEASREILNLYFILCAAIHEQEPALLDTAINQLMAYQWKQQFQSISSEKAKKLTPEQMREKLLLILRKRFKTPVEIKESFTQEADAVNFKILFRKAASEPWKDLVSLSRPRVTTARLAAFEEAYTVEVSGDFGASAPSDR